MPEPGRSPLRLALGLGLALTLLGVLGIGLLRPDVLTVDQSILLGIVLFTVAAFAAEWMPIDQTALVSLALLLLFNLVTPEQAVSGFSNPAVITVMMMFVLSESLIESGVVTVVASRLTRVFGRNPWPAVSVLMLVTGISSAFINNVAAMSLVLPVAMYLSKHYRISPSKLLLPLSYASIFGGACTLIGTSTNLLASALSEEHGAGPFSMFEFLELGLVLFAVGIVYNLAVPARLLPDRIGSADLTRRYQLRDFLTEIRLTRGSGLIGKTVVDEQLADRFSLHVLEILRGKKKIATDLRRTRLKEADVLIVRGAMEDIVRLRQQYDVDLPTDVKLSDEDLSDEENVLAEVQVAPNSKLVGRTIKEIDFRRHYGCFVLAVARTGETMRDRIASIPLQRWDTLLVFGPRSRFESLRAYEEFIPLQELDLRLQLARRWWIGALVIPAVMILAASGLMPILKASILGVVAVLVTRRLTIQQAYKAINWAVIFLVAAIIPLGRALENTGLDAVLGGRIIELGMREGAWVVLAFIYLATAILAELISNNSTVVLMVPISFIVAAGLGVEPKPFLMAVTFAASSSFLTPVGYKTNAMVYGPGGYNFLDYIRAGLPLKIIFWLLSTLLIPVFWPFVGR